MSFVHATPAAPHRSDVRTKRVSRIILFAIILPAFVLPSRVRAEQVLDQQQTRFTDADGSLVFLFAQTFTASVNGPLTRVDLLLQAGNDPDCELVVQIRNTSGGEPTGSVIASSTLAARSLPASLNFVPVTFAFPATVTDGTQYAVTLTPCTAGSVDWAFNSFSAYAFGEGFTKIGPTGRLATDGRDYAFKTFVLLPSPVLVSPANGSTTSDRTPLFSGIADTSNGFDFTEVTVEIFEGASTSGQLLFVLVANPDDANGAFAATPDVPMPDGTFVAQVVQDNTFGEFGRSEPHVFAIDGDSTTPPAPPGALPPSAGVPGTDDTNAPGTTITSSVLTKTKDTTPLFTFTSNELEARFECSVDGGDFVPCISPFTLPELERGKTHSFAVHAIDADGNVDPTPARAEFKVKKKNRRR
jgi:hypothetical protein